MLNRGHGTLWPAALLAAITWLELGGAVHAVVDEQAPCRNCQHGCLGECMCTPNLRYWGFFERQWREWPGERREDKTFPKAIGEERVPAPKGTKPEPLPKEEYAPPPAPTAPTGVEGIKIQEGATKVPGATPPSDTGAEQGLPGLPLLPEEMTPGKMPIQGVPAMGTPPAPTPAAPTPPAAMPPAATPTPSAPPAAAPPKAPTPAASAKPQANANGTTGGLAEQPRVELSQSAVLEKPATLPMPTSVLPEAASPIAPLPPTTAVSRTPSRGVASLLDHKNVTPRPTAQRVGEGVSSATKQPVETAVFRSENPPAAQESQEAPAEPWAQPREWKSRRAATEPSAERPVGYIAPVDPTVALDGYCPVELVRNEAWVEGNPRLAVQHEGRTYLMSSPAQHREFRAHPERYAPALAGCDPVLALDGKGRVSGRTDACAVYEGRLYMFADQETLARFRQNPKPYVSAVANAAK
jgi:YHS domain-containing protein